MKDKKRKNNVATYLKKFAGILVFLVIVYYVNALLVPTKIYPQRTPLKRVDPPPDLVPPWLNLETAAGSVPAGPAGKVPVKKEKSAWEKEQETLRKRKEAREEAQRKDPRIILLHEGKIDGWVGLPGDGIFESRFQLEKERLKLYDYVSKSFKEGNVYFKIPESVGYVNDLNLSNKIAKIIKLQEGKTQTIDIKIKIDKMELLSRAKYFEDEGEINETEYDDYQRKVVNEYIKGYRVMTLQLNSESEYLEYGLDKLVPTPEMTDGLT